MKKQKGMIITAAVLLAAAAVVTGSRLIRHPEKSNTKKSEVADQEKGEKEQDHRTSGTEPGEKTQNMNEPDNTQKKQSVENADHTGKSFTEEAFYISKIPDDIFLGKKDLILEAGHSHSERILPPEESRLHTLFFIADDRYRKAHALRRSLHNISVQEFYSQYFGQFPGNGTSHTSELS